ncbi:GAF and ANTAR domain-containing protein [Mycolicibacterium sp. BiH015]|uniref:GAF and ANTAR domain-containing protein n=1 Tax=Mycolicibacterium sp. BiH015 TaxID=3018808 RepID=UPI0022E34E25|nr:GAF and ANTAR domain-containing protein [Mycolicibacterium sp. BiH015]MDA2891188.1 GAF and ANTAR domain-containing protein [Mycolicibacterium sp. BiH015]
MTLPSGTDLAARMADLASATSGAWSLDAVLDSVTAAAAELIPGVDTAGILLIRGGAHESISGTAEIPKHLDELQMSLGEGPCMQAALDDTEVVTDDFASEARWPRYSPAVVDIGVLSGMSFKMFTADRTAGALNLFGFQPRVWDDDDLAIGGILAAHATAAILAHQHVGHLRAALRTRDQIGQAKGMIMERYGVDHLRAFEMMREISQTTNAKLFDVARQVIETR